MKAVDIIKNQGEDDDGDYKCHKFDLLISRFANVLIRELLQSSV